MKLSIMEPGTEGPRDWDLGLGKDGLAVAEGVAGGANFGGEDLKDLEREVLVAGHEGEELVAGDEAEDGAGVGDGCEGIRLVADEAGKA